ncbi:hypothetical protein CSB37_02715 [bacterium DOLZORAL124_38_8]|nr:MAG: hypothetical protein CSB37_02715 [bacterium DOLZORAL124_38_8]
MNVFELGILGLIQGFTEFLPISSSGHLFLAQKFFGFMPNLSLEIWLHVASLLAVVLVYWKDILNILVSIWKNNDPQKIGWKLALATICTVPLALIGKKILAIEPSIQFVGITLFCTAGFLWLAEKFRPQTNHQFTWLIAALTGLVQGIAILPGISRSGITIAFLILVGLNRKDAAKYSFLLSIPTILGGFLLTLKEVETLPTLNLELGASLVLAFVASYLSIKWMINLVEKNWLWFVPYCLILGLILQFV